MIILLLVFTTCSVGILMLAFNASLGEITQIQLGNTTKYPAQYGAPGGFLVLNPTVNG